MFTRLSFQHPHAWHSDLPAKRWDREKKTWIFPPRHTDVIAREYRSYLVRELDRHALRLLNEGSRNLTIELEADALVAGRLVGVRFTKGFSKPRHVVDGDLSAEWLIGVSKNAARWAAKKWDPDRAAEIREAARQRGQKSKRPRRYLVEDLPVGSIKAQAEALGCSRATVCRLRREAAGVAA